MKMKTRNIIAISVTLVGVLAIAFVVALAVIKVSPVKDFVSAGEGNSMTYDIRYGAKSLDSNTDGNAEIGSQNTAGAGTVEKTSFNEIVDMMSFSVFKSWSQFKYDYGLSLNDTSLSTPETVSIDQMKSYFDGTGLEGKYSFTLSYSKDKELTLKNDDGASFTQTYDTAVIVIDQTDGQVGNINAYVFKYTNLYGDFDRSGYTSDTVGIYRFYTLKMGAVTTEAIDLLDDVFDPTSAVTPDDGEEETEETE